MFTINPNASVCYNPTTLSWNNRTDCCSWMGVHCEETTGQVIELDLACSGLQGKFHSNSSLFQLSKLKRLYLYFNNFSGSLISAKFGELSNLTHLDLSHSGFTGVIPAEISHLSKLQVLSISTVDPYGLRLGPYNFELLLKNLTQLRKFHLDSLRGVLPERVFHLSNLEHFELSSNSLTGSIPSNVSGLQNLQLLYLSSNYLNGTILSCIFSLPSLFLLDLSNNFFSGKIQEFKSNTLEFVSVKQNQLQGPIPKSLLDLQDVQVLILSQNNFSVQIASTVCNLKTLSVLDLGSNHLNRTIPQCLGEMSGLTVLGLNENSDFSGHHANTLIVTTKSLDLELPRVLTTSMIIDLSRNRFEGYLPSIIGDLVGLRTQNLSHNGLEGIIPASLQHLSVLE
ncbi:hypothetical protein CQW23_19103, partial [Capsicum baccatum]